MGVPSSIRKVVCRIEGTNLPPPSPQESKFSTGRSRLRPAFVEGARLRRVSGSPWNMTRRGSVGSDGTLDSRTRGAGFRHDELSEIGVSARGMRGAILGEWGGGFNQENGDAAKKILSPKSVDISVDSLSTERE